MRFRVPVAAATAVVAWVLWTAPVFTGIADPILDWNLVTLQTIRELRLPPPRASRVLAMVHAATFDAVNGIELTFEPYYVTRPAVPGASADAAAAAAAHGVLTGVFPDAGPYFDAQLAVSLSGVRPPAARNKGVAWGRFVAGQILKLRRDDGSDAVVVYTPSGEFGRWEPTPPGFADALLPQWPQVTPFVMWSGGALRPVEPPELSSLEFATAFLEVKELGSVASVLRTADETQIAFFWEDGPGSA
ncbi:MAG TPA: hypothetical protein VLA20_03690, partial [Vicinamibacterales bacterium]|nr:hypothetical protein [Vicinamibacterales bacterium]